MPQYDVIVLGGGPAGLSAAARIVWLGVLPRKKILPLRVAVFDSCKTLGGLARWQPVQTFGPGMFFTKKDLEQLRGGCEAFGVEFRHAVITSIACRGSEKTVVTSDGERHTARALIIATGARRSFEMEPELYASRRLLFVPVSECSLMVALLRRITRERNIGRLAVIGSAEVNRMLAACAEAGCLQVDAVVEPSHGPAVSPANKVGRVVDVSEQQGSIRIAWSNLQSGLCDHLCADAAIVDFDSYGRYGATIEPICPEGLECRNGFVVINQEMGTSAPGVFSAGDVTGPPLAIGKALAQGMTAGFSAYIYVYRAMRGEMPSLYPYYPSPA